MKVSDLLTEQWSKKYKRSINCNSPKGFSQKAHCAGRKARKAGKHTKSKSVSEAKKINLGDCFQVSAQSILYDNLPGLKLVHAYVTGQGPLKRRRYEHAWNEIGDVVIDKSNGRQIVMRKEQYYQLGNVVEKPGEYVVYDADQARKKMFQTKNYVPWDLSNISTTNENFKDGRMPGRKGLAKRSGVNCKQSVSKLRKVAAHSSGERQRMAHWCANMKSGRKKTEEIELDERSKSQAQWDLMHAVADNPMVSQSRKIPQWVGQEFATSDIGHDRNALPVRVPKKPRKKGIKYAQKIGYNYRR
jgi:hypothetical protein